MSRIVVESMTAEENDAGFLMTMQALADKFPAPRTVENVLVASLSLLSAGFCEESVARIMTEIQRRWNQQPFTSDFAQRVRDLEDEADGVTHVYRQQSAN